MQMWSCTICEQWEVFSPAELILLMHSYQGGLCNRASWDGKCSHLASPNACRLHSVRWPPWSRGLKMAVLFYSPDMCVSVCVCAVVFVRLGVDVCIHMVWWQQIWFLLALRQIYVTDIVMCEPFSTVYVYVFWFGVYIQVGLFRSCDHIKLNSDCPLFQQLWFWK